MPFSDLKNGRFQPFAVLPVLVTLAAFILSFLLVFAGNKPGYMEEYAVFTLNTSRIGENWILEFDEKILGLNFSNILSLDKRSANPVVLSTPTATPTPTITMAPRGISSLIGDLTSDAGAVASDVGGKVSSVESAVGSKVTALETAAAGKINSAIAAAETAIVEKVNEVYDDMISSLELKDFYSIHMMTTCTGTYAYNNGTNITIGVSAAPANNTHKIVNSCDSHSALDPVAIVRVLYEIGIALTGLSLLLGIYGVVRFSRGIALLNVIGTLPAVLFIGLASAAVHGVAVGAAHLINFAGAEIGVAGYAGKKFIAMTWAATILLLVNAVLWTNLLFFGEKLKLKFKRGEKETKDERALSQYEMTIGKPVMQQ